MSDNIDIPVSASGDDGVNRLTSAIDRLTESMTRLGDNSALNKLSEQMQLMQATMVTGFANLAATAEKTLQALGGRQAQIIEENGNKAAAALEAAGLKIKAADARTWEQVQRGSASNVTAAFNQLAQGIPVEAVTARYGQMATAAAQSLDGQLEKLKQFQANAKSLYETSYRPMAGATEAEIDRARAMNAARDAALRTKSASNIDARTLLGLPSEAESRTIGQQIAAQMRESVTAENLRARSASTIDVRTLLGLPSETEVRAAGRRIAAQLHEAVEVEQAAERNRGLNASFLSASPLSQLNAAGRVQSYLQQPGSSPEGAAQRFGSAAASADINALRAAYEGLGPAVTRSSAATASHNQAMQEAHSLARGLAGSLGGLWLTYGSLIPLAAGAAIAASLKSVVTVGAEVEHQLTNVLALTKSSVNLDQFLSVSDGSLRSLIEGANAMRMLAQNGLNAAQSLQVLPSILDLATVGEMTVGQAALAATGAASAFGLSYSEAGRIADIFAVTAANSNTSVLAMTESMRQASTVASLFKVSIEETAAMLGLLAKINVTGGAAGTSLTNMLTGLYEPTEKGKKALKELGVETQMASGALKPLTQLLEEMRGALSQYSDSARVDLLGSIFTVRGVKSAQLALENIDDFKKKTEEAATATGFMAGVVKKLEDDTTGGFQRLGVEVQNSFVRSFQEASPFIQGVALSLGDMFKPGGSASTGLQNFSTNIARLTGALVENLDVVTLLAGGYVAMRALGPTTELVMAAVTASAAHTTAAVAETTALGAVTAANLGAGASAELVAGAVAAQTAATEAATAATVAWEAALLPVLGAVAIAAGVAAAAWLLFRDNTDQADQANQKIANSLHVIGEALDREIAQLEKSNALWNAREGRYNAPETVTQSDIDSARAAVTKLENEARAKGKNPNDLRNPQMLPTGSPGIMTSSVTGYQKLSAQIIEADRNLAGLLAKQDQVDKILNPAKAVQGVHNATAQLREELDKFYNAGMQTNSQKEYYQQNPAVRAVHAQAETLKKQLLDTSKVLSDPEAEQNRISAIRVDLKQLQDQSNALRNSKVDVGDKDSARVRIEQLQEELRLKQMLTKTEIDNAKSANKRGELGDIQLINLELEKKLTLDQKAVDVARAELAAAGPLKPSQQQKFQSKIDSAEAQKASDTSAAQRALEDTLDRMDSAKLSHQAKTLAEQGQLQDAFNLQWEADYGRTLANLDSDIEAAEGKSYQARLKNYKQFLLNLKEEGEKSSIFKMDENYFNADIEKLKTRLNDLKLQNGPGTGLSTVVNNQLRAGDAIRNALPQLTEDQLVMQADAGDDPVKQKAAQKALKQIQEMSANLRNEWVGIGQTISQALTDAFGRGGAAIGGLMTSVTAYGAKVQDIKAEFEKSDGGTEAQKQASEDMAAAQVKAYGSMTTAAKGFFDTNSHGYKILHAAEQAFRIYELAMAVGNAVKKIALEGGVTAAVLGGEASRSAAVMTGTETQIAADMAKGTSAAAVAVATQAQGDPYSAWIRMAAMAAAMASLGFAVMGGVGGGATDAQQRQEENGTGTIAGDPKAKSDSIAKSLELVSKNTYNNLNVSMGMLASLQAIEANLSNFAGLLVQNTSITNPEVQLNSNNGFATTLATAGGLLGGGLLGAALAKMPIIGKISTAIFGGKQTLDDSGFTLQKSTLGQIAAGGASAQTYADVTTDGGWFRSDSHDTKTTMLAAEANRAITQVITSIGDTIRAAGAVLGMSGSEFDAKLNGFVIDLGKISLKDLSSSEQQAAIQTAFSKLGDQMAQSAFSTITQFSKAGEGALETLARVATDYQAVDAVFKSFGTVFSSVGMESIAAREHLIDLAGGLDKFTSQASFFFENFLTKGQQTAASRAAIDPTLVKYGLSTIGPDAVKHFADVTIAMGTMGAAGAEAYTELMSIAPAFKAITDVAKDLQDQIDDLLMTQAQKDAAARAQLDPANQLLFDQLQQAKLISTAREDLANAYQGEATALQSSIDKLKSFSLSLKNFINSLQLSDMSPLNPADKYGAALSQFNTTLAKAQAGDTDAQSNLQSVAQAFLQASKAANASNSTYQSDYQRVLAVTSAMANWADGKVTEGQQNLAALRQQVEQLTTLNNTTLSVVEAINNLAVIMAGGKNDSVNSSALISLYKELLGRTPDAAGFDFWMQALQNGTPFSTIIDNFKNSSEYYSHTSGQSPVTSVTPSTQYGTTPSSSTSMADQLTNLYQQVLGRAPDAAGFNFWLQAMQNGTSLSTVASDMMKSSEYADHTSTRTTVMSDPYVGIAAQNSQMIAQLTSLNGQIIGLRTEQQTQAEQQVAAVMTAGANTGEDVAEAITSASQAASWNNSNQVAIR
jgi:TP901 family phage tail tape measure protein